MFDRIFAIVLILLVTGVVIWACFAIPEAIDRRKKFDFACQKADGIIYRTRDGSICLKKDSVVPNL